LKTVPVPGKARPRKKGEAAEKSSRPVRLSDKEFSERTFCPRASLAKKQSFMPVSWFFEAGVRSLRIGEREAAAVRSELFAGGG